MALLLSFFNSFALLLTFLLCQELAMSSTAVLRWIPYCCISFVLLYYYHSCCTQSLQSHLLSWDGYNIAVYCLFLRAFYLYKDLKFSFFGWNEVSFFFCNHRCLLSWLSNPFLFFYIIGLIVLSLNLLSCIMNRDLLLTIIVFPTCMNALVIYCV